jgi:hypothetical protein
MGFIRFYGLVVREAFRHSLDIAQGIIFLVLLVAGAIAYGNPEIKPMIEAYDLGGWRVAAIVFGGIILIRLILAPYWLWRAAQARSVATPEQSIDYKLTVSSITSRNDKKAKAIQIVFVLHNASYFHSIKYEVEEVYVEVDGNAAVKDIIWSNRGEVIPPASKYNFDYDWIHLKSNKWIKPGTGGHVRIIFKYGAAGQPFTRRVNFASTIVIEKTYIRPSKRISFARHSGNCLSISSRSSSSLYGFFACIRLPINPCAATNSSSCRKSDFTLFHSSVIRGISDGTRSIGSG